MDVGLVDVGLVGLVTDEVIASGLVCACVRMVERDNC